MLWFHRSATYNLLILLKDGDYMLWFYVTAEYNAIFFIFFKKLILYYKLIIKIIITIYLHNNSIIVNDINPSYSMYSVQ